VFSVIWQQLFEYNYRSNDYVWICCEEKQNTTKEGRTAECLLAIA
jgi:hypothetical protein